MCPLLGLGRAFLSNEAVMGPCVLMAGVSVTVGLFQNKQGVAKVTRRNDSWRKRRSVIAFIEGCLVLL
jgi:hypothetical protein